MLGMSKARVDKLGLVRLLLPSRYNDTANLNFIQPYDPKRIPVLFVHGLDSTPATFAPMYFKLLQDPEIRKNYQFWVFSYPSGYPYPYSASPAPPRTRRRSNATSPITGTWSSSATAWAA